MILSPVPTVAAVVTCQESKGAGVGREGSGCGYREAAWLVNHSGGRKGYDALREEQRHVSATMCAIGG